jgi:glutamate dehydrogenase
MENEHEAMEGLAYNLHRLGEEKRITLVDRDDSLIVAYGDQPGTLYNSLASLGSREISYAEISHSNEPIPGVGVPLEVQRFEFKRRTAADMSAACKPTIPASIRRPIFSLQRESNPKTDFKRFARVLDMFWINNEEYIRHSPPARAARAVWLYMQGVEHRGLYIDAELASYDHPGEETRILFAVGNPPATGFIAQVIEALYRLNLGVRRAYCLDINNGLHPYFIGTFYVSTYDGKPVHESQERFSQLRRELHNTQVLNAEGMIYERMVMPGKMTGEEATLTNAMVAFCHTNLAHNQPDRYDLAEVERVFLTNRPVALKLAELFRIRFAPRKAFEDPTVRREAFDKALADLVQLIENYNTGHRHIDEVRRKVFETALLLVTHTLKTNFYVIDKHALAFRLDTSYLSELGEELISDLPADKPYRITFFFSRHSAGYHVGFSDIARGGWRSILCRSFDDFLSNATTLLREVFVLAHTQHLKNKDIYEGGSKLAMVVDVSDLTNPEEEVQRLYKAQFGLINAFLDIYVTEEGKPTSPLVIDYFGEDEPIELGPDENMHDEMIEFIARLSEERGYILGKGIMSSKAVGINHKEYGVTSLGVITCSEIVMRSMGIDMHTDPFSVKITGGPNGDVAGNAMKLLIERCPKVKIKLLVDGSGVIYDPEGLDLDELWRLLFEADLDGFDPEKLHPGGYLLYRSGHRKEGLSEHYRKAVRTKGGVEEQWISSDDFFKGFSQPVFDVEADLFIPAGGRPETVDMSNWQKMLGYDSTPTCRAIVEGANSFITPDARVALQEAGVVLIRDASANKCGVISSSYEIIANLLLTDAEFKRHKARYVDDVLSILASRAASETELILNRRNQQECAGGTPPLYTEVSAEISTQINVHYARLFQYFSENPELTELPHYRKVILNHLPRMIGENARYRKRIGQLPVKYRCAILASELATTIVYKGGWETDFETTLEGFVRRNF